MELVEVAEAARTLDVSKRQVQRLMKTGDLVVIGPNRIDYASVLRLENSRRGRHTRAWSADTAWGAIALLSGLQPDWMGATQRSRLLRTLRTPTITSDDLVARARNRAIAHHLRGHRAAVARVRNAVVHSGSTSGIGALTEQTGGVDGYVSFAQYREIVRTYQLTDDSDGMIVLRTTEFDLETIDRIASTTDVLAAIDLAESIQVRERTAGLERLDQALEDIRGTG